jgi:flagellar biosynthesis protein FliR
MNSRKVPTAMRVLLPLASAFLILGIVWPYIYHPATQMGKDWSDALRGLILGLAIGVNLTALWKYRLGRGCHTSSRQDDLPQH